MNAPKNALSIQISRRTANQPSPQAQEYVVIHWKRIFCALVLCCAVLALLGWVVWGWYAGTQESRGTVASAGISADDSVPPVAPSPGPVMEPASPSTAEVQPAGLLAGGETQPVPLDSVPPSPDEPVSAAPDIPAEASPPQEQAPEPRKAALAEARILSPHLSRVQLTSALEEKEPVDQLPARVEMNGNGLLRVYLFTETRDLQGQVVYHDWHREGRRVARIAIRPYSDHMRASSSKYIDRHMLGHWRVEVVSVEGAQLAWGDFDVVQAQSQVME
ncbi:MAG: DUF2914 domain-containing protein [Marinobacter sp.]|uniref:DUF2914 domain-containing protein n=1 Tax=Marinobacter sp. TaxID=50741 RepID=UPI00299D29FD|nr:DUF2914 domain-containing protein [Marinobacter sp.]MDX1755066.1 DUF2914 domain-containing protein [Marinobacter sp.]